MAFSQRFCARPAVLCGRAQGSSTHPPRCDTLPHWIGRSHHVSRTVSPLIPSDSWNCALVEEQVIVFSQPNDPNYRSSLASLVYVGPAYVGCSPIARARKLVENSVGRGTLSGAVISQNRFGTLTSNSRYIIEHLCSRDCVRRLHRICIGKGLVSARYYTSKLSQWPLPFRTQPPGVRPQRPEVSVTVKKICQTRGLRRGRNPKL